MKTQDENQPVLPSFASSTVSSGWRCLAFATLVFTTASWAAQPLHDMFATPGEFGSVMGLIIQETNVAATKEPGEPNHAGNAGGHSLWYRWQAPLNALAVLDAHLSTQNPLVAVYTGSNVNALSPVASSTNGFLAFNVVAGQTYLIAIDGANGATGTILATVHAMAYSLTTFVGSAGSPGSADGTGTAARFNRPAGVTVDATGRMFMADSANHTIRAITLAGEVTTFAGRAGSRGSADGFATFAQFNTPTAVAADALGNLYVADSANHSIRKISASRQVTTLAGLPGTAGSADGASSHARFNSPARIAVDPSTGIIYVSDHANHTLRRITPDGVVTTIAGSPGRNGSNDGAGAAARFFGPMGLGVGRYGDIYVSDTGNNTIRKVTSAGVVTTIAGLVGFTGSSDGLGAAARFDEPDGIAVDHEDNIYVADFGNRSIRHITPMVTSPAGFVVTLLSAPDLFPIDVALARGGNLLIADLRGHLIRRAVPLLTPLSSDYEPVDTESVAGQSATFSTMTPALNFQWQRSTDGGNTWTALADNGVYTGTNTPQLTVNPTTTTMSGDQFRVVLANGVTPAANSRAARLDVGPAYDVSTLAGSARGYADGTGSVARFSNPFGLAVAPDGNVFVADGANNALRKVTPAGVTTTISSGLGNPLGVSVARDGVVYFAESTSNVIRGYAPNGTIVFVAGHPTAGSADGYGSNARFTFPIGLAATDGRLFVVGHETIREIVLPGSVTTMAGAAGVAGSADGPGPAARFRNPTGIVADAARNLYVADNDNHTIRHISPARIVSTLAGTAGVQGSDDGRARNSRFNKPCGVALDARGNLFVADSENHTIRRISSAGYTTTVAGSAGLLGASNARGSSARFQNPTGIAVDASGALYIADYSNHLIRKAVPVYDPPGIKSALTAAGTIGASFNYVIAANSNAQHYAAGGLPAGLALNAATGLISGTPATAGHFDVLLSAANSSGTGVATLALEIRGTPPPRITTQPVAASVTSGTSAQFTVAASSASSLNYAWQAFDGTNWIGLTDDNIYSGTTTPVLTIAAAASLNARQFRVVVRDGYGGSTTSASVVLTVTLPARLVNLSTRGQCLTTDNVLIPGFVITGSAGKRLLIRVVGPTLTEFGVSGALSDPTMVLKRFVSGSYIDVAVNNDWGSNANAADIIAASAHCGAFVLPTGSRDAALLLDLPPGQYTVVASGTGTSTGVAIVELYDTGSNSDTSRLANIATRGYVGTGDAIMIPGFVVSNDGPRTLLIRAVGPTLTSLGVAGALVDPRLVVYRQNVDGTSTAIFANDDWGLDANAGTTAGTASQVGAFALAGGSKDAAIVVTLQPGVYTVQASGGGDTAGTALVEVYEVP